ncbi:MAG: M23 family metallopeptidase [Bryobacteraceae bacterium]
MPTILRIVLFVIIILILPFILLLVFSSTPVVEMPPSITALGPATPVTVQVTDPHGIRKIEAWVEQNGARFSVYQQALPARRLLWARHVPPASCSFTAGTRTTPQLKDGKARLVVEAASNDFRGASASISRDVTVVSRPPGLNVDSGQHYLYLGMADLVTFSVSGYVTEAGVRVGDNTFRSWPMPGGKPGLFSLYAFPWNTPLSTAPLVYAANPAGTEVTARMVTIFPPKEQPKYRVRDLLLDDAFVQRVVSELDPHGSGELVDRFVKINRDMRRDNNKTLFDLRDKTEGRFLWSQPFLQEHNSQVESSFADVRNYIYHGRKVDQEVHLGYDLAITPHIGVEASNDGKVVYAAPLGIYGNCIVVDHGYGLQSIYGHMSEFAVREGDMVKRGQIMGKSGMTGMAGGDHIHFSMQLDGIQIDPKEFFDAHWIRDHIAKRVDLPGSP